MSNSGTNEQTDLAGQVAIVTGGGRGIGRAMALALAKAGAAVAVVARSRDQLAETVRLSEKASGRAIAVTADVTDQQAVEQMARGVEHQLGLEPGAAQRMVKRVQDWDRAGRPES